MLKKITIIILFGLLLLSLLAECAFAADPDQILSNSQDWKDVYSTMLYGSLTSKSTSFLVSNKHATLILGSMPKGTHVWSISSKKVPYVVNYKNILESKGFTSEEFIYDGVNLELAKKLNVKNFIIIDDAYGYNAISVAPYAVITNSYVLFTSRENIGEVDAFLSSVNANKITIYGQVDREVRAALNKYNPEVINKEGDRFLNNIEIVKKYLEIKGSKQVILTNGEFIEKEIMSGTEPVVFIGTNNVPDVVRDYIKKSEIQVGVLIGNELVGTATYIRRQIGISVFVKFAQGARAAKDAISQVEALDMFYLPIYTTNLELDSVKYNQATNQLEVSIKNTQDQAAYFIGTYTITASDGAKQTAGDVGASFIDSNELKTLVYDVGAMPNGKINVEVFIIYGESKGSLEKEIRKTVEAQTVRVLDECDVKVDAVAFNERAATFYVDVENTAKVGCFVDLELIDVIVAGEKTMFGLENATYIDSGDKKSLKIKANLQEGDIEDNQNIKVKAYYGERENSLVKVFEGVFALIIKTDYLFYSLIIVIIILIILIIWKRYKRKKRAY